MIQIEDNYLRIVRAILAQYPYTFYAFGSRTKNQARRLSDLDLCVMESIPGNIKVLLEEDFEESDLPFIVEIVEWDSCAQDFRDRIRPDFVLLQEKP